jgi:hypothetical protein
MNKKTLFRAAALGLCVLLLTGANSWEGTARVAAEGELPETGNYAATNSFPRNTVVDISNLENGKTVRVVVASSLRRPGFLAILSRDAAAALGIQDRSLSRISVNLPSGPTAYIPLPQSQGETDPAEGGRADNPDQTLLPGALPAAADSEFSPEAGDGGSAEPETEGEEDVPSAFPPPPNPQGFEVILVPSERQPPAYPDPRLPSEGETIAPIPAALSTETPDPGRFIEPIPDPILPQPRPDQFIEPLPLPASVERTPDPTQFIDPIPSRSGDPRRIPQVQQSIEDHLLRN